MAATTIFTSPNYLQLEGLSACEDLLFLSASRLGGNDWSGELRAFRAQNGRVETLGAARLPYGSSANHAFDSGGLVCCAGDDGGAHLFGLTNDSLEPQPKRSFREHDDVVSSVHVNPVGSTLVTGSWDSSACVWDVETGTMLQSASVESQVRAVRFLNYTVFVTAEAKGAINVWDTRSGIEIISRKQFDAPVCSLVDVNRTHIIAGLGDGTVLEWTPQQDLVQILRKHNAAVHALAVSPENGAVLSGADDGRVYSVDEKVHTDFIRGAAWLKGRPVTSSWDGTVKYAA